MLTLSLSLSEIVNFEKIIYSSNICKLDSDIIWKRKFNGDGDIV
jgi:hypothetical protein